MSSHSRKTLLTHRLIRLGYILFGTVLFVGTFGLMWHLVTGLITVLNLKGAITSMLNSVPTIHRDMCLRMPLDWLILRPEYFVMRVAGNPLYALIWALIPLSFIVGPVFCGWLCPAAILEYLSRLMPKKIQLNFAGKADYIASVRYGFFIGYFVAALPIFRGVLGSICCSYCNWTWTEHLWEAVFGDFHGFLYWSTAGLLTFILWFFILGIFTRHGRGWCAMLCPAGAAMNLAHSLGKRFRRTYKVEVNLNACTGCGLCVEECPMYAITKASDKVKVSHLLCNACLDCIKICPVNAISYSKS